MAVTILAPLIGKAVRALTRLRGGGTAFPGKVIESIDRDFLHRTLGQLPFGVVLVSGTNGKTTTTRIISSMLKDLGLKVFTNPTGSNFTRGVASALIDRVDLRGKVNADIAVLELDEAYAVHFVEQVKPQYTLLLNVMRDQLDRFGEIDTTARLLAHAAGATGRVLVLNREDSRISALAEKAPSGTRVSYFGLSDTLTGFFPSDDDMHDSDSRSAGDTGDTEPAHPVQQHYPAAHSLPADVVLTGVDGHTASYTIGDVSYTRTLRLEGVYNLYNAAAALGVVRAVMSDVDRLRSSHTGSGQMMDALAEVTPAFGRGETVYIGSTPVEMILVKNPMGFRLALKSFPAEGSATMIIINDEYADGRDMSWLWDVEFTSLAETGVAAVSGVRADDMALRLAYDSVPSAPADSSISRAVRNFVKTDPEKPHHIYCTYTAMLAARKVLSQITRVEDVGL